MSKFSYKKDKYVDIIFIICNYSNKILSKNSELV